MPPVEEAWDLNHWTTREVPKLQFLREIHSKPFHTIPRLKYHMNTTNIPSFSSQHKYSFISMKNLSGMNFNEWVNFNIMLYFIIYFHLINNIFI